MKWLILFALLFAGCGLQNGYYVKYNVQPKAVFVSNVGSPIILIENYCKNEVYNNIYARFTQELDYTGKQGGVIKIFYKEFSEGFARPAFTQELTYDLSQSDTIQYKSTKIRVIEANNNSMKYEILETPLFRYPSDSKIDSLSDLCTQILMQRNSAALR